MSKSLENAACLEDRQTNCLSAPQTMIHASAMPVCAALPEGSSSRQINAEVTKALKKGELHPELREVLRLVDPHSDPAIAFEQITKGLYQRMVTASTLPARDTDISLAQDISANAVYLPLGKKNFILNSGLCVGPNAVGSIDGFASVLAHELAHREFRERYGVKGKSSKFEEAFADGYPIFTWLWDAGFNPKAALRWAETHQKEWRAQSQNQRIANILDEHPSAPLSLALAKACLAWLELERGDCGDVFTPIDSIKAEAGGKSYSLSDACRAAKLESIVEVQLRQLGFSKGQDVAKDLGTVADTLSSLSHLNSARAQDIYTAISCLKIDTAEALQQIGINKVTEAIFLWAERGETEHAASLYQSLSLACLKTPLSRIPPIGRLASLEDKISNFIEAHAPAEIASAAAKLRVGIEAEPLCNLQKFSHSVNGRTINNDFLGNVNFSHFATSKPGNIVAWQNHFATLVDSKDPQVKQDIFSCLVALGVMDYRALAHVSEADLLRYFSDQMPLVVPEMTWELSAGNLSLHELRMDVDGMLSTGSNYLESRGWEHRAIQRVIERYENSTEILKFQALFDHINRQREVVPEQGSREQPALGRGAVALSLLPEHPAEVAQLNRYFIADSFQAQSEIVAACRRITIEHPESARQILRDFFIDAKGQGFFAFGEYCGGSNIPNMSESKILGAQRSPFVKFICEEGGTFLSPQEQLKLVATSGLIANLQCAGVGNRKLELDETVKTILPVISKLLGRDTKAPQSLAAVQALQETLEPYGDEVAAICTIFYLQRFEKTLPLLSEVEGVAKSIRRLPDWWSNMSADDGLELQLIGRVKEKLPTRLKLNADLDLAICEIRAIGQYGLLAGSEFHDLLGTVLDRVMQSGEKLEERLGNLVSVGVVRDPSLRKRLFSEYADEVHRRVGVDDASVEYVNCIAPLISELQSTVSLSMRTELFGVLANILEAQRDVAFAFRDALDPFLELAARSKQTQEVLLDAAFNTLTKFSDGRELLIQFIFSAGTPSDIDLFLDSAKEHIEDAFSYSVKDEIQGNWTKSKGDTVYKLTADSTAGKKLLHRWRDSMQLAYSNFWEAPLPLRATMCANLFFPEGELSPSQYTEVFERVLKIAIPGDVQNREELLSWTRSYIQGKDRYKQPFYLAALATAMDGADKSNAARKVGDILATLAEQMGPAELKFAQAGDGHPGVPEDFRPDPIRVKTKADVPYRWKFFEMLDKQLTSEERGLFGHIGPITNAGSIYVTAQATANDGRIGALSVERLYTANRAASGFRGLDRMIDNHRGSEFEKRVAKEMIDEGRRIVTDELDGSKLPEKVSNLKKLYSGAVVKVNGSEYSSDFVDLYAHGQHFRFTQWVDGEHTVEVLNAADRSPEEKRKLAVALVAIELTAILKGMPFCNDRHGGNSKQLPGNRTLHFDPGGAMVHAPSNQDMQQLAEAIFSALNGADSASKVVANYLEHMKGRYLKNEELPDFLKRTQKAFSGLGEYFRLMSEEDTVNVLVAALPHAHPALISYAMTKMSSLTSSSSPLVRGLIRGLTSSSKAVEVQLQS